MNITIPKHRLKKLREKVRRKEQRIDRFQKLINHLATNCPATLFEYALWIKLASKTGEVEQNKKNYPDADENMLLLALIVTHIDDLPEKIVHLKSLKTPNNRPSSIKYDIQLVIKNLKKISTILKNESTSTNLEMLICDSGYTSKFSDISLDDFIQDRIKHISVATNLLQQPTFKNLEVLTDYPVHEFEYFYSNSPNAIQKCIFSIINNIIEHLCYWLEVHSKMIERERIANILTYQLFSFVGEDVNYLNFDTVKKMRKKRESILIF